MSLGSQLGKVDMLNGDGDSCPIGLFGKADWSRVSGSTCRTAFAYNRDAAEVPGCIQGITRGTCCVIGSDIFEAPQSI